MPKHLLVLVFSLLLISGTAQAITDAKPVSGKPAKEEIIREPLVVHTHEGDKAFTVELAVTPAEQEKGLMFRTQLEEGHGMLFLFNSEENISMWMKDTLIPLDMFFINQSGVIIYIEENTTPKSQAIISPGMPVKAVLELAGGAARKYGIRVGDTLKHKSFKP